MNEKIIHVLLLMAYCVPYGFLAMWGDAEKETMLYYGVLVIGLLLLCLFARKRGDFSAILLGNTLSAVISACCVALFRTEKWSWYFKPMTPMSLLCGIYLLALLAQVILWKYCKKKTDNE